MRNPEWESTLLKKNGAQISTKLILSPPCQTGSKMGEGIQLCNDVKKQFKVMLVAEPCTGQEQQAFCPPPSSPWGLEFCLQKFPNLLQIIFPPPWIVPVRAPESSLVFLINFYWAHFHDQCRIISYNSAHGKKFKRRISFYYNCVTRILYVHMETFIFFNFQRFYRSSLVDNVPSILYM